MPTLDQIALALSDPNRVRILDILAAGRDDSSGPSLMKRCVAPKTCPAQ